MGGGNGHGRGPNEDGMPSGLRAVETVRRFLEEANWSPVPVEGEEHLFRVAIAAESGLMHAVAQVLPDAQQFLFYIGCTTRAPEERRGEVMAFLTRANYGLRIGAFEFDLSDGEVRFRSALDFEGEELTIALVRNAVVPAIHTMDRYLGGLMKVMFGGMAALDAINEIEGSL